MLLCVVINRFKYLKNPAPEFQEEIWQYYVKILRKK